MLQRIRQRLRSLGRPILGLLVLSWLVLHCQHCLNSLTTPAAPVAVSMPDCEHDAPAPTPAGGDPAGMVCECHQATAAFSSTDPTFGISPDYASPDFALADEHRVVRTAAPDAPLLDVNYADRGRFRPFERYGVRLN
jgi:hypothetical protein